MTTRPSGSADDGEGLLRGGDGVAARLLVRRLGGGLNGCIFPNALRSSSLSPVSDWIKVGAAGESHDWAQALGTSPVRARARVG